MQVTRRKKRGKHVELESRPRDWKPRQIGVPNKRSTFPFHQN